jgi:CRISPR-associated protein Cmr2
MSFEIHAAYDLTSRYMHIQKEAVEYLTAQPSNPPKDWPELAEVQDPAERLHLLAQALLTPYKDYARVGQRPQIGGLLKFYQSAEFNSFLAKQKERYLAPLGLLPGKPDLTLLPAHSFALQFTFKLRKPYLSRDDTEFYILENPVRKDKVFRLPMVSGTSWKGNLRWAAMKTDLEPAKDNHKEFVERRLRHTLLFGSEKGLGTSQDWELFLDHRCTTDLTHYDKCEDDKCGEVKEGYRHRLREHLRPRAEEGLPHLAGRLRFYPTFFDQISLEVINPHPRDTGAGKLPIYFESVPAGASGIFALLYVPFQGVTEGEARKDLACVAEAIAAMMRTHGFSAKKSSGFGVAEDELVDGQMWARDGSKPLTKLSILKEEVKDVKWS